MTNLINNIIDCFATLFDKIIDLLPASPFAKFTYMSLSSNVLGILNYFLPIAEILVVLELWLVAVGCYYVYKFILKFIRME